MLCSKQSSANLNEQQMKAHERDHLQHQMMVKDVRSFSLYRVPEYFSIAAQMPFFWEELRDDLQSWLDKILHSTIYRGAGLTDQTDPT